MKSPQKRSTEIKIVEQQEPRLKGYFLHNEVVSLGIFWKAYQTFHFLKILLFQHFLHMLKGIRIDFDKTEYFQALESARVCQIPGLWYVLVSSVRCSHGPMLTFTRQEVGSAKLRSIAFFTSSLERPQMHLCIYCSLLEEGQATD